MELLLLAAGRGARLGTRTRSQNKCLIEVDGLPLLEHSLELLDKLPLNRWNIVVGYKSEQVIGYINSRENRLPVRFIHQKRRMGIAHAMKLASKLLNDDMLLNHGDEFLVNDRLAEMISCFSNSNADFLCGVIENSSHKKISAAFSIRCDQKSGYIIEVKEKPVLPYNNTLGTGYCIFSKEMLKYLDEVRLNTTRNQYELCDFITLLIEKGKRGVCFPVGDDLINVNTDEDLHHLSCITGVIK